MYQSAPSFIRRWYYGAPSCGSRSRTWIPQTRLAPAQVVLVHESDQREPRDPQLLGSLRLVPAGRLERVEHGFAFDVGDALTDVDLRGARGGEGELFEQTVGQVVRLDL